MITRYLNENITETELKYIAHGVNCQNKMGAGVAKVLYTKFPEVKEVYHKYCGLKGDSSRLLGEIVPTNLNGDKVIFNCFTQLNYGRDRRRYVNYAAIVKCLDQIKRWGFVDKLAIPRIGCNLGGGDWNIVEQLVNDTTGDDIEVWVYDYKGYK